MKTTKPQHIEAHTMRLWLDLGSVTVTSVGDENTYAINEFGHEFYAKDVPELNNRSTTSRAPFVDVWYEDGIKLQRAIRVY